MIHIILLISTKLTKIFRIRHKLVSVFSPANIDQLHLSRLWLHASKKPSWRANKSRTRRTKYNLRTHQVTSDRCLLIEISQNVWSSRVATEEEVLAQISTILMVYSMFQSFHPKALLEAKSKIDVFFIYNIVGICVCVSQSGGN